MKEILKPFHKSQPFHRWFLHGFKNLLYKPNNISTFQNFHEPLGLPLLLVGHKFPLTKFIQIEIFVTCTSLYDIITNI
jgi:hypothetical protein